MTARTKETETPARTPLFKVLVNGQSGHGGRLTWSLPVDGRLGGWHEHEGPLAMCESGLHLTSDPIQWWKPESQVYEAEVEGEFLETPSEENKICARKCRLLREVEWSEFQVWSEGHHRVTGDRKAVAYGSATVEAYGSATVQAYGSATVRAYGSATVRAYGSATVDAYDSATVDAYDSATVDAYDSATVDAYDSATVQAYDSATVRAYDSATVDAYDSATVQAYDSATVRAYGSATVEAYDSATVRAYGSATVEAYDSATVDAYDSATVQAYGSATVRAYGSATVDAYGSATVIRSRYHSGGSVMLVEGSEAVCVDRRGKVTVEIAKGAT